MEASHARARVANLYKVEKRCGALQNSAIRTLSGKSKPPLPLTEGTGQ